MTVASDEMLVGKSSSNIARNGILSEIQDGSENESGRTIADVGSVWRYRRVSW